MEKQNTFKIVLEKDSFNQEYISLKVVSKPVPVYKTWFHKLLNIKMGWKFEVKRF